MMDRLMFGLSMGVVYVGLCFIGTSIGVQDIWKFSLGGELIFIAYFVARYAWDQE